jgi:xylulokinase
VAGRGGSADVTVGDRFVIGLDCGTQSAKACIWDLKGRCVSRASAPLSVATPHPGWAEQDPEEWWGSARAAVAQAASAIDPGCIIALGIAFQRETFTLTDSHRVPLRPGILWLDIRASEETAEVSAAFGAEACHRLTGKPLDVTSAVPRMLWIARHEPDVFRRAARWMDVCSFVAERMTGDFATCVAGADTSGLVDLATRQWSPELRSIAGLGQIELPRLVEPGAVIGSLLPDAAHAMGVPPGLPVVAAGGDGQALSVGMGIGIGDGFTLTLGTSIALGLLSAHPSVAGLYRTLIAALPGSHYLLESVIQSGTYILRWFAESFGNGQDDAGGIEAWEQEIAALPPGSDGLVTIPHWWGVRFPESDPDARGATLGWSHQHTRAHFLRSILEGVGFELKRFQQGFARECPEAKTRHVTVCGGGARSAAWLRILCDIMGMPLRVLDEQEPTALGAAMLAAVAAGAFTDPGGAARAMVGIGQILQPDPAAGECYDAIYERVYTPFRAASLALSAASRKVQRGE